MRGARKKITRTRLYIVATFVLLGCIGIFIFSPQAYDTFTEAGIFAPEAASMGELPDLEQFKSLNEELRREGSTRIPILVYHSIRPYTIFDTKLVKRFVVTPEVLDAQLAYIKAQGYEAVSLEAVAKHFTEKAVLPAKPIVITFDDGWKNQYTNALPILQKHGMEATFFVFTEPVGRRSFVNWEQLTALVAAGMEIGDHTETHPYLYQIKDQKRLDREMIESKKLLEEKLGITVQVFATPFAKTDPKIEATAKRAGYLAARTESWGFYQSTNTLNLTGLEAPTTLARLKELLSI